MWLTPNVHVGDPGAALGLDHADVDVPGELGALPAWFVPAARDTWVITVHGLGTTREHPMNVMEFLHRHQLPRPRPRLPRRPRRAPPPGRPQPPRRDRVARPGRGHPLRRALRRRAASSCTAGPPAPPWPCTPPPAPRCATAISGLVLDSPVLDWETTLRALAAARRTPGALLPLAVRAAQGRTGLHGDRLDAGRRPRPPRACPDPDLPRPRRHGRPLGPSRRLAARRPDLVTLHTVRERPARGHVERRPGGYEEALRRFLTPLM